MSKRIPFLIGFFLLIFALWVQLSSAPGIFHFRERLEDLVYDIQLRTLLLTHKKTVNTSVAIVDIDDNSLHEIGRWPWSRAKVSELLLRLQEDGAVVVAFDVLFSEKEDNIVDLLNTEIKKLPENNTQFSSFLEKLKPTFDYDAQFAETLKKIDAVLGITFAPEKEEIGALPPPLLTLSKKEENLGFIVAPGYIANIPTLGAAAKYQGFINVFPDNDGIIRRVPLFIRYQNNLYPSLALEAVRVFLLANVNLVTAEYGDELRLEGVQVGNHIIPTNTRSQVIVPFLGKSYTMPYYSAKDVLNKKTPPDAFQGKIVFIGTSAIALGDIHATAVEGVYPGVEVHATIAHGILEDKFNYKPSWALGAEVFLTVIFGLIFVFVFPFLGPRTLGLIIFIVPVAFVLLNNEILERTGLIISILIPIAIVILFAVVNILYGFLFETLKRERLKEMFGQYVPEKHIDEMLKTSGKNLALQGEDREMTVLFADIRNFTTLSEPLSASQLKDLLNEFFTPMTEIIFKYRGTIDKYVGDLIMAFWGAPLKDKKHAQHALSAALEMQSAVIQLQTEFAKRNLPEINIGIGVNTGIMSVGDMGSKFRRNYTVLGDAVNLASRVESLTKYYGAKIIATEFTQKDQTLFVFKLLDRVRVKGKNAAIPLYELISKRKDISSALSREVELSNHALEYYFKQEWQKALELFSQLSEEHPDVKLYRLYLSRIKEFQETPPPSDWDGVFIHTEK